MRFRRAVLVLAGLVVVLVPGAAPAAPAARPAVLKVEPPSWWPGHSIDPVRLMVHGTGFSGARVEAAPGSGLSVGLVRVNARGTHLFVDVGIDPQAAPGARTLEIVTAAGRAEVPFSLLAPLSREGRFQGFSADDLIYLIMPDRFADGDPTNDASRKSPDLLDRGKARYFHGGDLQGVIDRLPYLKELGITAVWLNPIYDNTDRLNFKEVNEGQPMTGYHGYHAEDFYAVDERFGDLAKLRELVDAAHRSGIKVIQDQVANHTGPYHYWLQDPPTPTWFNGTEARHLANTWQVWTLADPHATDEVRRATLDGWFVDVLPDLNQSDEEVARYIIQNTLWWVGVSGFDGIREDTLPYVPRRFWRDWTAAIKREYPSLRVVGELFDGDPSLVAFFQGGRERFDGIDSGVDTLFDFPTYFALRRAFAQGQALREVAQVLGRDHLYVDPSQLVTFLGLHDVPRFLHEPGATREGLKLAFTFLLTARGIPLVYYGDEIAMPGGGDPDNRRDFPGGWAGDPRNAFEPGGRTPEEQDVFAHVQRLARLRAELAPLRRGATRNLLVDEQQWAFARVEGAVAVVVALNNAATPAALDFGVAELGLADGAELEDRLGASRVRVSGGRVRLALGARGGAVLTVRR
jgi:neopullulanase